MSSYLTARPGTGRMIQGFGPRPKPTPGSPLIHYGQDYGWQLSSVGGVGDKVYAARDGFVKSYAASGSYGRRLVIDHGAGIETWYCHTASALVATGSFVPAGHPVAMMGATGNVTAKHLHFELRINGLAVDAEPYFSAFAGGDITPIPPTPEKEDDMSLPRLYRKTSSGLIVAADVSTGFYWPVPNTDYVVLLRVRKLAVDEDAVEMADHEFDFLRSLIQLAQTTSQGKPPVAAGITTDDLDAIAKAVADEQYARLAG